MSVHVRGPLLGFKADSPVSQLTFEVQRKHSKESNVFSVLMVSSL